MCFPNLDSESGTLESFVSDHIFNPHLKSDTTVEGEFTKIKAVRQDKESSVNYMGIYTYIDGAV